MKYTIKALLIYLIAMAIALVLNQATEIAFDALHISLLGLFMYGSSVLIHYATMKATKENPKRFPAYFMAITGVKMLVYVVAIGLYAYFFQNTAIPVVVAFLGLYIIYTFLEVSEARKELKNTP